MVDRLAVKSKILRQPSHEALAVALVPVTAGKSICGSLPKDHYAAAKAEQVVVLGLKEVFQMLLLRLIDIEVVRISWSCEPVHVDADGAVKHFTTNNGL